MCGIIGILKTNSNIEFELLNRAADLLNNRGPNAKGTWIDRNIGFGHRRLSIIDLSQDGNQPMVSLCGRYIITYNGELYNFRLVRTKLENKGYQFKSNSDTEVILKAYQQWDKGCLSYFNGMFAFAIWDRKKKKLFLARDRIGIKPLYYYYSNECFAFASRPGALNILCNGHINTNVDPQAVRLYLECGYIPAPYALIKDVKKLLPGHYLEFDFHVSNLNVYSYWDFRCIEIKKSWNKRSENDLLDELDELISSSVKARMISDVPLGTFLSGGIDSSLITAIAQKYSNKKIQSFTIGFKESGHDESCIARCISDSIGTEHSCEYIETQDLIDLLPNFFSQYDEPFFDHSAFSIMALSRFASKSITVSLSGDGGDELFGGYHYYRQMSLLSPFFKIPQNIRKTIANYFEKIPSHKLKLACNALKQSNVLEAFVFSRGVLKDFGSILSKEMLSCTDSFFDILNINAKSGTSSLSVAEKCMRIDIGNILVDDYMQKVDIGSMAFSLEARVPLLDHNVVEWALKLPEKWKINNGINKYLLRQLAYRYVPKTIINRPKTKYGFGVPISKWLKKDLKKWAEERIYESDSCYENFLNKDTLIKYWKLFQENKRDISPLLWTVLVLIEFLNQQNMK